MNSPTIATSDLICYKTMPIWTADTLPQGFQQKHNTKIGTWAKLTILKGALKFYLLDENGNELEHFIFTPDNPAPFIEPQQWHKVEAIDPDFEGFLEFYCTKEQYFHKKYNMTATHSEVISAVQTIAPCKVLDLGCGQGRNSLYLSLLGYDVTALDHHAPSILNIEHIANVEKLEIQHAVYDIHQCNLPANSYDWIISTVVLMFLQRDKLYDVVQNMQHATKIGGYHLIVAAMDTDDVPCTMPFPSPLKAGELKQLYQGWEFLKYEEAMGELHKTDAQGNRIQLKFVTMLAKKIS